MAKKRFLLGALVIALVFGMTVLGCEEEVPEEKKDNTIFSVSISLGSGNDKPKVGSVLSTSVKNKDGDSVSGVTYQWKSSDLQYGTFTNINNATTSSYIPVSSDYNKYIKVEVKNSDTPSPVLSDAVGPVDGTRVDKPTADPAGGEVVSGQEITLASTTESATIYYTLDGTEPTSASTAYYSYSKPKITNNCTLKVIAMKSGLVYSEVLSVSYTVAAAPSFTKVTSSAAIFNGGIYSITYGNNKFVAGGSGYSGIAYSSNGTTWTTSTGNTSFLVQGITYGTRFIAVGYNNSTGGVINYSSDGTSWSEVTTTTFGTSFINDVAYGGGTYVAVGNDGKIAYSSDGSSWTAVTTTQFDTSDIKGITYGADKFIAVGRDGKMAYSTNGTAWTAVADSKYNTSAIYGVTYGGPAGKEKFIAVGSGGLDSYRIAYSTDGETWTSVSQYISSGGLFDRLNKVAWGGNKFVVVAGAGVMLYSLDGTYWARIDGGTGAGKSQFDNIGNYSYINDITYGGGKFLAVGVKSNNILGTDSTGEMAISN